MNKRFAAALAALAVAGPAAAFAKDTLDMGMVLEPPHLDPTAGAAAAIDEVVYANVFEGLVRIAEDGSVAPALAKSWQVSDDGLVYTFELQDGVTFHDGSAFDAEDVVFSLDRATAEDSVNAQKALFEAIERVEAVDENTVKITLERPDGNLLFNLGWGDAVIVAPETAEGNKTNPVGTGPFVFEDWARGSQVTLKRNEDYWGEPAGLSEVTFKFIPDAAAATAAIMAGDVDAFANHPAPEALAGLAANPEFEVVEGTTEGEVILALNNGRPPLDDARVRRAIAHAVDREEIIAGSSFGRGVPIGSHFAPHHPAYVDLTGVYPHDPDKARALLEEAGVEDLALTLKLPPPSYARRSGEIVAAELREVGVEVEIVPVEWAQWLDQVFTNRDYDMTIVAHTEPLDINIYARDDYYFDYHNPDFAALMDELNATTDPAERNKLLEQAQRLIAEDSVNAFLYQLPKLGVWRADLQGLWRNSPVQANDLTAVRWGE